MYFGDSRFSPWSFAYRKSHPFEIKMRDILMQVFHEDIYFQIRRDCLPMATDKIPTYDMAFATKTELRGRLC